MKKLGFAKRLLTLLLALSLVVSSVPGVNAAIGDTRAGDTGLTGDIDTTQSISWPIKIYDHLNDGMLFEYAATQDFTLSDTDGDSYGGGQPSPMLYNTDEGGTVGTDYTVSTTYSAYSYRNWDSADTSVYKNKFDTSSGGAVEVTKAQQPAVDGKSPMYLHLEYPTATTNNTKSYVWVSNFANDRNRYYSKEEVRYAVVVYRTNDAYTQSTSDFYWAVSDGYYGSASDGSSDYYYHTVNMGRSAIDVSDLGGIGSNGRLNTTTGLAFPKSTEWSYVYVDMMQGDVATNWDTIDSKGYDSVAAIGMGFPINNAGEEMDISHIAYFATEGEAKRFGEKAVAFNNDPGEYLPGETITTQGSPKPTGANFELDFTKDSTYSSSSASALASSYMFNNTAVAAGTQESTDKIQYARLGYDNDGAPDESIITSFSSATTISSVRYIVIVYSSSPTSASCSNSACGKIGFWFQSDQLYNKVWYSNMGKNVDDDISFDHSQEWTYKVIDMVGTDSDIRAEMSNNSITTINKIGMVFPGFDDDHGGAEYLDVSHIAYFSSSTAATNYGKAAVAYNLNPGGTTTTTAGKQWNMGSNTAFSMLYASQGGGWMDDGYLPKYDSNWNVTSYEMEDEDSIGDDSQDNTVAGGYNAWSNGYYSYQIGKSVLTTGPMYTLINKYREELKDGGAYEDLDYEVSDDIFLVNLYNTLSGTGVNNITDADGNSTQTVDMQYLDLGYTLYNLLTEGVLTVGLLESDLITVKDKDGNSYKIPEYKDATINYIAQLLEATLVIPEKDEYGYNYNYVQGTANGEQYGYDSDGNAMDLASALRKQLKITFSGTNKGTTTVSRGKAASLDASKRASLIGEFADCVGNIDSFAAAAYYLLHNLFVDDSYNQVQPHYNYLVLSKGTVSNGTTSTEDDKEAFVFDAGFTNSSNQSAVVYDRAAGTIGLSSAAGKGEINYNSGSWTTLYPFLPVYDGDDATGESYTATGTPYFQEDGASSVADYGSTYLDRNYNYVMQANGEFVYHYEDGLFFDFEGDDDVYLFVNGQLVLDIGAAHSITKVGFEMNDYVDWARKVAAGTETYKGTTYANLSAEDKARVDALNLKDGESYSIDFYYMERHGTGANMRIATNIVMTDPALQTNKTAYQGGGEIPYGGTVTKDEKIEYSFSMTNAGNNKLYRLSFVDNNIGIQLDSTNGLTLAADSHVTDANGGTLDPEDLVITVEGYYDDDKTQPTGVIPIPIADTVVTNADGSTTVTKTAEQNLIQFLYDLQSGNTQAGEQDSTLFAGAGLWRHGTVTIRGIFYTMPSSVDVFDNTVYTNAYPSVTSDTVVKGEDTHRIRAVSDAVYFYQWAGHNLYIEEQTLIDQLKTTMEDPSDCSCGAGNVLMALTDADNNARTYDSISNTGSLLTVNYTTPGTQTITYVTLYQDSNNDGVADKDNTGATIVMHTVPVVYHVTDVEDTTLVLDYGLKAELTNDGGIYANDTVNISNSSVRVMGLTTDAASYLDDGYTAAKYDLHNLNRISFTNAADKNGVLEKQTGHDGQYSITDGDLYFTPTDLMDGIYTVNAAVTVHQKDYTPKAVGPRNEDTATYTIDIAKEVQMYQSVTVLPANVVYYEDDFTDITYSDTGTFTKHGDGSVDLIQGVAQNIPYGQDPQYADTGEMSGNSLTEYSIPSSNSVFASFTFTGTGFEILSRTDAVKCGTMLVKVTDSEGKIVRELPVITEFDNIANGNGGSEIIYQVPVIRVDGLTQGTYHVEIAGSPEYDVNAPKDKWIPNDEGEPLPPLSVNQNTLYIDGIRIFQPMGSDPKNDDGVSYYNTREAGASFSEIRQLLLDSQLAFVNWDRTTKAFQACTGNLIWTENRNGVTQEDGTTYTSTLVDSIEDYLVTGPNNELYFLRTDTDMDMKDSNGQVIINNQMLLFYVEETVANTTGALQIGVRGIDGNAFQGSTAGTVDMDLRYLRADGTTSTVEESITVVGSSTEQYYNISYTNCPYTTTEDGKKVYTVMILADRANASTGMLSFTSLKHNGLTIKPISEVETDLTDDQIMSGTSWSFDSTGMLVNPEGQTYGSAHFDLRQISQTVQDVEEARLLAQQKPAAPNVNTVTPTPVDKGMDKTLKLSILVVSCAAVLAGAWYVTKKYLHLL